MEKRHKTAEKYISKQHRLAIEEARENRENIESGRKEAIAGYTVDGKKFNQTETASTKEVKLGKKAQKDLLKKQRELKKAEDAKLKQAGIKTKSIKNNK